jgi:hypothetical protein
MDLNPATFLEKGEEYVSARDLGDAINRYYRQKIGISYFEQIADSLPKSTDYDFFWAINIIRNMKCKLSIVKYKKHIPFERFPTWEEKEIEFEPINKVISIVSSNLINYACPAEEGIPRSWRTIKMCETVVSRWVLVCASMIWVNWGND